MSDTGSGIDPAIIDRIFDPYFTTKEFGKGTGMGLSVVHGIVKNHDGAISVASEPGKGTVFSVFFPLTKNKNTDARHMSGTAPKGKETVLFVDDEPAITMLAEMNLKGLGYTVETALTPIDALVSFRKEPDRFDLVITDMTMPHMTGVDFFGQLRKIRPDIPAIICTGFSTLIDESQAKKIGFGAYLAKPISKLALAHAVRKVLDKKHSVLMPVTEKVGR